MIRKGCEDMKKQYVKPQILKAGAASKVVSMSCNGKMARNCNQN